MDNEKYQLRKEKSEAMIEAGVKPVIDGFNEYIIPSQTEQGLKYKVTIKNGWYACQCPDNAKDNLCKHILFLKTHLAIKFKEQETRKNTSTSVPCPACENCDIQKNGTRKTIMGLKQRWLCLICGKRFVNTPIQKVKGNEESIITAIDLYMKGVSYRGIADTIRQLFGLEVTHVTIMNWVSCYMGRINDYVNTMKPQVGEVWHADEQLIKAKGKQEYVWNVLDGDTLFLLASNESPTRNYNDARETFQQAKAVAGKKAQLVVTDGAFNYQKAVRKEFATYANPKPHYRYVSIRAKDASNNKIERFHNTFRQRDKVMRGFGGKQKQYAENFKTYYNFVKTHQGLKQTPAQKAGIDQKAEWRELLLKAVQHPMLTTPNSAPEN